MAAPLTPSQILAAIQGSGLDVYEMPGWRGKCRCHSGNHEQGTGPTGRGWGPINGVTVHLTTGAANSGQAAINYAAGILTIGRADTPGPLVQFSIDADGRAIIIAAGRSNHAGAIGSAGLAAMVAENFSLDGSQNLRGHDVDGNTHTFGIEIQTPVTPSAVQHDAAAKLCAAICRAYGWSGQEVHGHGEVSDQRGFSDPNLDMGEFRRDVMSLVVHGTPPSTDPMNITQKEDDMLTLILWCYAALVGRTNPPSVSEIENWVSGTSGWTAARVLDAFLGAPCEPGGVVKAYADFLGRAPSAGDIDLRVNAHMTIRQVRLDVAQSPEVKH